MNKANWRGIMAKEMEAQRLASTATIKSAIHTLIRNGSSAAEVTHLLQQLYSNEAPNAIHVDSLSDHHRALKTFAELLIELNTPTATISR